MKANTNWEFVVAHEFEVVGVVIRNDSGVFMAAVAQYHPRVKDATRAEFLACSRAANLAGELVLSELIIETNSLEVMGMLAQKEVNRSNYGSLVQDLKMKLSPF